MNRRKLLSHIKRPEENDFTILPSATFAITTIRSEIESQKIDKVLRNRYLYIFINGVIGIALMIVELQVSWNSEKKILVLDTSSKWFRGIIFFSSILLLCQLMDYYRLLLSNVTHGWLTKRARGFRVTPLNVLRSTQMAPLFWTEVLITILQPIPFASGQVQLWNDPKWGLLMWLRIYMFGRVFRDFSHVYKIRHSIVAKYREKNEVPPKFNWALSMKTMLYQRPLATFIPITLLIIFICSHIIYVFEREAVHSPPFTYAASLYVSFLSMFTGWPTDTYDVYNPSTFFGRFGAIMSSILGLFMLACLIEQFSHLTHPTAHQKPIMNYIFMLEVQEQERNSAAKLIQVVWRRHRWQNDNSFAESREVFNSQEALFSVKYIEAVKAFGRTRRYRKQIQNQVAESNPNADAAAVAAEETKTNAGLVKKIEEERQARKLVEERITTMESNQILIINQLNALLMAQGQHPVQPPSPPIHNISQQINIDINNNNNNNISGGGSSSSSGNGDHL
ncbi:hypothetical protein SAMD00019534_126410 [Acytostelium subglobosum LB1]|uniref:hypothetical protein n=1 Tax=Acytostelium subglobosum LB1 TaxID=1410327 RepID=UPI000644E4B4|nr:hypothetical protein SAMD00019534_126410 [Acytostelium subglobosum LB1]GAM29465.1 hypothetical protein SAMD00019534_126410 [Acytostelium subglobosum LB1]|eukprot:XP_012747584.1 hypothetical protein SAMD00019534_126410 [Acytostelium subglobosum LB1]